MPAWLNLVVIISMDLHPIRPVEFDLHLKPLTGNVISMDLHPIRPGINYWSNSLRLHCMPAWSNLVVIISMDLHPIRLVKFDWHLEPLTGNVISMDLHPI